MSIRSIRYNTIEQHFTKSARASTDRDALAFLEAAQIYNTNQQRAIVNLVRSLKRVGLWSKMKAIYPFVGGTASSHKWNLKDPRDVDAAFRLAFNGGWTHSANGALPNGSTGWADTYLKPSTDLLINSTNYSIYLRTNNTTQAVDLGAWQTTGSEGFTYLYTYISGPFRDYRVNDSGAVLRINNPTRTNGYFIATRVNSTTTKGWRNTTLEGTGSVSSATVLSQYKIGLGALNGFGAGGTPALYSNREIAFATIGADTLTDTDATNLYYAVDIYQRILGRAVTAKDTDAQAFVDAAVLTDSTQIGAVDNLVSDLKAAGLWSKMKAIYPFVGGTASSHKWNLKDPRDVNAAFRLAFNGGWTHSANGADPNGSNAYADTNFDMTNHTSQNNAHCSHYCTDNTASVAASSVTAWGTSIITAIYPNYLNQIWSGVTILGNSNDYIKNNITDSRAYIIVSRIASNEHKQFRNNATGLTNGAVSQALQNYNYYLGAGRNSGGTFFYSPHAFAFATIGDGLTDTDASNLYNIVQRYQRELGRNVVPFDTDAQNFVVAAGITDQTQITAIDNLVKALKDTNLWSKMKAIYPFVGGTATTHKWNLKDPRDLDAAFRLVFYGGWTHSSTGAYPNGTSGYADTFLTPNTSLGLNSNHMSFYSRIDQSAAVAHDLGCSITNNEYPTFVLITKYSNGNAYFQTPDLTNRVIVSNANSQGYYIGTRTANNLVSYYRNGATLGTNTGTHSQTQLPTVAAIISAYRFFAGISGYSAKQTAFVTFGDGLTSMDVYNLNNIVQNFQTTLGRAV